MFSLEITGSGEYRLSTTKAQGEAQQNYSNETVHRVQPLVRFENNAALPVQTIKSSSIQLRELRNTPDIADRSHS